MSLPMKKRTVDQDFQRNLEANAVFLLAHRLTSPVMVACGSVDAEDAAPYDSTPMTLPVPCTPAAAAAEEYPPVMISPPWSPLYPLQKKTQILRPKVSRSNRTSSLPTANDPNDESFFERLYSPGEEGLVNPTHVVMRKRVLEVRRTLSGKVYFQCGCCKHLPRSDRAKYSTIAPQSLKNLYHAFIRFMMYHAAACEHIPQEIRELGPPSTTKDVRATGIKKYWQTSALEKGLRDGEEGIVYVGPATTTP